MIEIKKLNDIDKIKALCKTVGIDCCEYTRVAVMVDGDKQLGYSIFDLQNGYSIIRYLEPIDDLSLADGMLRSTIHISLQQQCPSVYYATTAPEPIFESLGFIMNKEQNQLNTHKLFETCDGCK